MSFNQHKKVATIAAGVILTLLFGVSKVDRLLVDTASLPNPFQRFSKAPAIVDEVPEEQKSTYVRGVVLPETISPSAPVSFSSAKRVIQVIHEKFPFEIYCGCRFDPKTKYVDANCPLRMTAYKKRQKKIEWEHVVFAADFGRQRPCWKEAKAIPGEDSRSYCRDNDTVFRAMEADPFNLLPAIGSLNAVRSDNRFGEVQGEQRNYGQCDFEYDKSIRRVEPPEFIKGDVARIHFYMEDRYHHAISSQQRKLFMAWHKNDPVDDYERLRAEVLAAKVGWVNPYAINRKQPL